MQPIFFQLGDLPVTWFGLSLAAGFLAGLGNWVLLGRREGFATAFCSDLLFWLMVSGILGARVAYVAANLGEFLRAPWTILYIHEGGLIYYGGFLGGGVALVVLARRRAEPFLRLVDFVITSVPLAHAFGRIGCFMNGCCHGTVTEGPLAVRYPSGSLAWHTQLQEGALTRFTTASLPVHPVQLYESAANLALYGVLLWAYRQRRRDGDVAAVYLLGYPLARFCFEFLRGDQRRMWGSMTVAQALSMVFFAAGALLLWYNRTRPGRTGPPA